MSLKLRITKWCMYMYWYSDKLIILTVNDLTTVTTG